MSVISALPNSLACSIKKLSPKSLASVILLSWALGTLTSEGITQAAAAASLLMALVFRKQISLPSDLRWLLLATFALFFWQTLSPVVAFAVGNLNQFPRASRWSRSLDILTPICAACVASIYVPRKALFYLLGIGWSLQTAVGLFQHLVRWPFGSLGPLHVPVERLHKNFSLYVEMPRFAGTGLLFHRLRFAHGAIAALGPAVSSFFMTRQLRCKAAYGTLTALLILCTYIAFTRAALGAAVAMVCLATGIFLQGRKRILALLSVLLLLGSTALSTSWQDRYLRSFADLFDRERSYSLQTGYQIARQHPLLGIGFGSYKILARPMMDDNIVEVEVLATSAHNYWLTIWVELGIIGVVLALFFYLTLAYCLLIRWRKGCPLAMGGLLSLVGFHVIGLFHHVPFHSGVMLSFALFWGLGLASVHSSPQSAN